MDRGRACSAWWTGFSVDGLLISFVVCRRQIEAGALSDGLIARPMRGSDPEPAHERYRTGMARMKQLGKQGREDEQLDCAPALIRILILPRFNQLLLARAVCAH